MWRRDFLKVLPLICWSAHGSLNQHTSSYPREIYFYLAGARYYKPIRPIKPGQSVHVIREALDNKTCFAILDEAGDKIGYVPKHLVSVIEDKRILDSSISSVREFAVPWRRYRVRILASGAWQTISAPA